MRCVSFIHCHRVSNLVEEKDFDSNKEKAVFIDGTAGHNVYGFEDLEGGTSGIVIGGRTVRWAFMSWKGRWMRK